MSALDNPLTADVFYGHWTASNSFVYFSMPVNTICWSEQNISVMDEVLINNPYSSENCILLDQTNTSLQCLNFVKKSVRKFYCSLGTFKYHMTFFSSNFSPPPPI